MGSNWGRGKQGNLCAIHWSHLTVLGWYWASLGTTASLWHTLLIPAFEWQPDSRGVKAIWCLDPPARLCVSSVTLPIKVTPLPCLVSLGLC